ncbi:MAG: hypothetical protein HZB82_02060 [Deltaproteobacteria bacterium]|nr:hypothetical protein [Deltaproteobacteria bacterium]
MCPKFRGKIKCYLYTDSAITVQNELKRLRYDIAGIKASEDQPIREFIRTASLNNGNCKEAAEPIRVNDVIAESTALIDVLSGFKDKDRTYFFILNGRQISEIITKSDLQKSPVRILIFGIISLLEMRLTSLAGEYFPNEKWRKILKQTRIEAAEALHEMRKERNEEIDLTDCLQLADKRDLVLASKEMRDHLGLETKGEAQRVLKSIEKIRDKLAHSQEDIVSGTTWEKLIESVLRAEQMLQRSDEIVEKDAQNEAMNSRTCQ